MKTRFNNLTSKHKLEAINSMIDLHDKYSKLSRDAFADNETLSNAIDDGFNVDQYFDFEIQNDELNVIPKL